MPEEEKEEPQTIEERLALLERGIAALFHVLPTLSESYTALIEEVQQHRGCLELILNQSKASQGGTRGSRTIH